MDRLNCTLHRRTVEQLLVQVLAFSDNLKAYQAQIRTEAAATVDSRQISNDKIDTVVNSGLRALSDLELVTLAGSASDLETLSLAIGQREEEESGLPEHWENAFAQETAAAWQLETGKKIPTAQEIIWGGIARTMKGMEGAAPFGQKESYASASPDHEMGQDSTTRDLRNHRGATLLTWGGSARDEYGLMPYSELESVTTVAYLSGDLDETRRLPRSDVELWAKLPWIADVWLRRVDSGDRVTFLAEAKEMDFLPADRQGELHIVLQTADDHQELVLTAESRFDDCTLRRSFGQPEVVSWRITQA